MLPILQWQHVDHHNRQCTALHWTAVCLPTVPHHSSLIIIIQQFVVHLLHNVHRSILYICTRPDWQLQARCSQPVHSFVHFFVSNQTCEHNIFRTNPQGKGPMKRPTLVRRSGNQGHTRLNIDLEAWCRHHSQPLGSSSF